MIIVCGLSPMDLRVALPAYREQVARYLLKHADVSEVMDFGWRPLAAPLAFTVGAPQNVLAPLAPECLAEIPMIGDFAVHVS